MKFIGREKELKALDELGRLKTLEGAIIYGRRRCGKTTLIKEYAKRFEGTFVYYQCLRAGDAINARGLSQAIVDAMDDAFFSDNPTFAYLLKYLFARGKDEPILLVLDEYPYLSDRIAFDSLLQSLIDENRHDSKMKVILAGSSVGIMESILDEGNPLHGRFRYKIKLGAFDYLDASAFYPSATLEDKIAYYAVFGGIPYYLSMIEPALGFEGNVKKLILGDFAPLENEILTTMREEYGKIENAAIVMDAIARGKHSYLDIKSLFSLETKKSDFAYAVNALVDLGFLEKRYDINDLKKKRPHYAIADNLFAFYFEMVFPNASRRVLLDIDTFYAKFVEQPLRSSFIPLRFESVCKEFLIRLNQKGGFSPLILNLGSYTYNDAKRRINRQFDLVAETEDGPVFFECKFTNEKVGMGVYREEKEQIESLGIQNYRLGFFSKSGFAPIKGDAYLFSLKDIYGAR